MPPRQPQPRHCQDAGPIPPQTFDGIVNWQRFVFLGDFSSRFRHIFKIHFLAVNKFTKKSRIHL
jgi:hypothetical protein